MNAALVQDVVQEVMRQLEARKGNTSGSVPASRPTAHEPDTTTRSTPGVSATDGVFADVDAAVNAAQHGYEQLQKLSLDERDEIVKLVKQIAKDNAREWGRIEFEETGIGRLVHKVEKLQILELVPGVEALRTEADSGTNGICLEEYAPFGVIGIITPVTHSVPTLSANVVNMVAAGNAIVANPHPSGANCAALATQVYNRAIRDRFGIDNLITCIVPPTLETADKIFSHRGISLLVVTGGPGVARAALRSRKRAIVAGPGNPPVVVDETADIDNAAKSIIAGAAYDNNLLCIGEKQVFCVERVADELMRAFTKHGAVVLNAQQIEQLTKLAMPLGDDGKPHLNKDYVGKDATFLARAIGLNVPPATELLVGETQADHPFVQEEQMMPFVPVVRCGNVKQAMDLAIESEHGYRHTALIHSKNLQTITEFGSRANVTLFVVNGASMAGLGLGGQGHLSYSIATPTGEGITTPLTFTRYRRMMITGSLRMI